jgi:hypothetical protein
MADKMRKIVLGMGVAGLLFCGAAGADDLRRESNSAAIPAVVAQISLANKLIALGDARKDPLLLIAAAKIQKNLGLNSGQEFGQHIAPADTNSVLERARKYANGQSEIIGLADDVAAMKSKGFEFDSNAGQVRFTF